MTTSAKNKGLRPGPGRCGAIAGGLSRRGGDVDSLHVSGRRRPTIHVYWREDNEAIRAGLREALADAEVRGHGRRRIRDDDARGVAARVVAANDVDLGDVAWILCMIAARR